MSKRSGLILFALLAALFLIANRGAYSGYFQDDEIDNLSWAPYLSPLDFLKGALTPRFQPNNFRPVGHYYFHAAEELFGLDFPKYVAVIHAIHLLNVWLLWLLARRLGAKPFAAGAGCAFFAFHMALFDTLWKPMYIFDILCAMFCLFSLLCYAQRRWVLSFAAFWLAYKSKELAVMLPVVLACYEIWFGQRRWKPLAPFFLVSLSFGMQGMLLNPNRDNDYTFRFTVAALAKTSAFYASRVFFVPYLGFVVPLFALVARNRRTWFGLATMGLFFFPMLFLPGRIFSAYCYVPFTGLAKSTAPSAVAAFLLLWLPMNLHELRLRRRDTLAKDEEARAWMTTAGRFVGTKPAVDAFVFFGAPAGFHQWGVEGALKYFFQRNDLLIFHIDEPEASELLRTKRVAVLTWDTALKRLNISITKPAN
jgi:hypothetical protein